jgi:hypothetical protein
MLDFNVNAPTGTVPPWLHQGATTPGITNISQPPFTPWDQDPGYVNAQNQQHQRDAQAAAYLNQQRQAALYQYNGAGNPYSTTAMLHQQDADMTRQYLNSLAARGILASGETGYQAGQESKRYGLSLYNAQNALNAALAGYQQTYIGQTNADADAANAALTAAWQNYLNNPSLYPRPGNPVAGTHIASLFGGGGFGQQIAPRSTVGQLTGTPGYGGGY